MSMLLNASQLLRVTCIILCSLIGLSGCSTRDQLRADLNTAQRERAVLRDAYDAQQLRIRELEARLVRIEDRESVGRGQARLRDQPSSSRRSEPWAITSKGLRGGEVSEEGRARSKQSSRGWGDRRLRALPIVRVRSSAEDDRVDDTTQGRVERPSKPKRLTRERLRDRKEKSPLTPTLTAETLSQYRDPDRVRPRDTRGEEQPKRSMKKPDDQRVTTKDTPSPSLKTVKSEETRPLVPPSATPPASAISETSPSTSRQSDIVERTRQHEKLTLAQSLKEQGRLDSASRVLREMISEDPTHSSVPAALLLMGHIQIEQGKTKAGKATLLRLSRLYSDTAAARSARQYLSSSFR